jgi:hypothetical protein
VDQSQLQPLKKCKKKPLSSYVSGCSLESRVTENAPSEASAFIQNQEINLSGYFLRRTVKKRPATMVAGYFDRELFQHFYNNGGDNK